MNPGLTSIIIVNYQTPQLTLQLLDSIHKHCAHDDHEIILIDNGSGRDSLDRIRAQYDEITYLENDRNTGFAHAANQGAEKAQGEYLWFLNSDCRLEGPMIAKLRAALESIDDAAAVTPGTVDDKGHFHSVCRKFPTYRNIIFSRGSLLSKIPGFKRYGQVYTLPDFHEITKVDAIAGTAMFIRRDDFQSAGGFDERFFLYFEDTDLCYRLNKKERYCYYVPEVSLVHGYQQSSSGRKAWRLFHHHLSALEYFLKWHSSRWPENLGLFFLLTLNLIFEIILTYAGLLRNNRD
jgi:GT2 family glycosyltransferase